MPYRKMLDDGSNGETAEGHAAKFKGLDDGSGTDDAEGHSARPGRIDDGSNDDTEGHVSTQQKPGKPLRRG